MGKVLVTVLGLGVLFFAAYRYLYTQADTGAAERREASAPKRTLENVRGAAHRIEDDSQKRADELFEKTGGN